MKYLLRTALILSLLFCMGSALALTGVNIIEDEAFKGDTELSEITLPEGLKRIGSEAFSGCENLSAVYCLSRDAVIEETAFDEGTSAVIWCYSDSTMAAYGYARGLDTRYYDAFSLEPACDPANACILLPFSWQVTDAVEGNNRYSFEVYKTGSDTPAATGTSAEPVLTFTPREVGSYFIRVTLNNEYTSTSFDSDPVTIGDKLYIGTWNGYPVEWTILTVNGNRALLLTKGILRNGSYFNPEWIKYKYCYWAGSYIGSAESVNYRGSGAESASTKITGISPTHVPLDWAAARKEDGGRWGKDSDLYYVHARYWCNETFYKTAFTDAERKLILKVTNQNADSPAGIDGGPETNDYVFFLSYSELTSYLPAKADRKCKGAPGSGVSGTYNWWLRTPGKYRVNAMYVIGSDGGVSTSGSDVGHSSVGYRPAMWIKVG